MAVGRSEQNLTDAKMEEIDKRAHLKKIRGLFDDRKREKAPT
jgi:hypothetical protein